VQHLGEPVEVMVVVQDADSGILGGRSDEDVCDGDAMSSGTAPRELPDRGQCRMVDRVGQLKASATS
jgi:hypothetical protein